MKNTLVRFVLSINTLNRMPTDGGGGSGRMPTDAGGGSGRMPSDSGGAGG